MATGPLERPAGAPLPISAGPLGALAADAQRICSQGRWYAKNSGEIPVSLKFVLSFLPKDNLVTKKEIFRVYTREEVPPKPSLDCGGAAAVQDLSVRLTRLEGRVLELTSQLVRQ